MRYKSTTKCEWHKINCLCVRYHEGKNNSFQWECSKVLDIKCYLHLYATDIALEIALLSGQHQKDKFSFVLTDQRHLHIEIQTHPHPFHITEICLMFTLCYADFILLIYIFGKFYFLQKYSISSGGRRDLHGVCPQPHIPKRL